MNEEQRWQAAIEKEERRITAGVRATKAHAAVNIVAGFFILPFVPALVVSAIVVLLGLGVRRHNVYCALFLPVVAFAELLAIASVVSDIFDSIFYLFPIFTVFYILAADAVCRRHDLRRERRTFL